MYKELFIDAGRHLTTMGILPQIGEVTPLKLEEISRLEEQWGWEVPQELKDYYVEMGDWFRFNPNSDEDRLGFMPSSFYDLKYSMDHRQDIYSVVELALSHENQRNSEEDLRSEADRRKNWFPFYNIGGGGYLLCLDLSRTPSPVCYHESVHWTGHEKESWNFEMAPSFQQFMERWAQFCFSDPIEGDIVSLCMDRTGQFDWDPALFEPNYQINGQ